MPPSLPFSSDPGLAAVVMLLALAAVLGTVSIKPRGRFSRIARAALGVCAGILILTGLSSMREALEAEVGLRGVDAVALSDCRSVRGRPLPAEMVVRTSSDLFTMASPGRGGRVVVTCYAEATPSGATRAWGVVTWGLALCAFALGVAFSGQFKPVWEAFWSPEPGAA